MKIFGHGILGLNARNLKYIRTKNSLNSLSLADSKLKTKNFLSGRGIPFAQTYVVISSQTELQHFSFESITADAFVIKPNQGSGGQGILIVKKKKNGEYRVNNITWTEQDFRLHMLDILQGAFSLHGGYDRVIIEELLVPGKDFSKFCRYGLADIRVIVYNYVPITAMVRMPTESSGGKANLAQGGIGLGMNIANGEIVNFFYKKQNSLLEFPEKYSHLNGAIIPFWDNILLHSSQVQTYTNLGYLALDWVITRDGPKLLEINARAGLEIQNVNLVPLEKRLKQVEGLKISSPEKGVEIAKTLFYSGVSSGAIGKIILHFTQKVYVRGMEFTLRVAPEQEYSTISPDIQKRFGNNITCTLSNKKQIIVHAGGLNNSKEKGLFLLGQNDLVHCLINPEIVIKTASTAQSRWGKKITQIDTDLQKISQSTNLSSVFRPKNYHQELSVFLQDPHQYNPVFFYNFPSEERIVNVKNTLDHIRSEIDTLDSTRGHFAKLFHEKCNEIEDRAMLIDAYSREDFDKIFHYNIKLFGAFDPKLLDTSTKKFLEGIRMSSKHKNNQLDLLGKVLSLDEVMEEISLYLKNAGLPEVPIHVSSSTFSRMAIAYTKSSASIKISQKGVIRKNEIRAILDHEIGVHLRRYVSGEQKGLFIFSRGTGYYIGDEEGLAIYNSFTSLPSGYEKNTIYYKYYLISQASSISFSHAVDLVRSLYPGKSLGSLFAKVARMKRGIIHTGTQGQDGAIYTKDKIYLDGYHRVSSWIQEGGDPELLYFGKIKIIDLPIISRI